VRSEAAESKGVAFARLLPAKFVRNEMSPGKCSLQFSTGGHIRTNTVSNTVPICQRGRSKVDRRPLLEFGWIASLPHLNHTRDQPGISSAGLFVLQCLIPSRQKEMAPSARGAGRVTS
jgi:hypothetical protein